LKLAPNCTVWSEHRSRDEAIRLHDKLLLILSEDSMKSEWVKTEIAKARKREVKDGKRVLFPVRLVGLEALRDWERFDGDTGKDSAREIREYFIPDFSNWKNRRSSPLAPSNLPSPEETKALAMPSKDRVWLNNSQHRAPVAPDAGQPDPQKAVHRG
jgi:hypothetical protein